MTLHMANAMFGVYYSPPPLKSMVNYHFPGDKIISVNPKQL